MQPMPKALCSLQKSHVYPTHRVEMHLQLSSITYSAYLEQVQVFAPNRVEQGQLKSRVCHISVWDILTCSSYSPSQTGWAAPPSLHERLTQAMQINPWAGSPWGGITCQKHLCRYPHLAPHSHSTCLPPFSQVSPHPVLPGGSCLTWGWSPLWDIWVPHCEDKSWLSDFLRETFIFSFYPFLPSSLAYHE